LSPTEVAVALILREGRLFLQRRDARARRMPCLWELPGGKLGPDESPEHGLHRELEEELRWAPLRVKACAPVSCEYPDGTVVLHPFRCEGPGPLHSDLAWGWFLPAESRRLALPAATRIVLDEQGH
jgi:8-oxo-dGTP diphosphatase